MINYRKAFLFAVIGNLVLVVAIAAIWWHSSRRSKTDAMARPAQNADATPPAASSENSGPAPGDAPLVPVQLSPERMQTIGVRFGRVERKSVSDEIRVTGNVGVDETRLAYVQTRFAGYIQKVFADATFQYLRKGQPLFTIYSPDLAATEQEYLVARQNKRSVATSTIPGVKEGADSLVEAAAERLKQWGVSQKELARLESTGQAEQVLTFDSPVAGYITERNALPNLTVQPDTRLYTVADLSTVWVFAEIFQNDVGRIKPGDRATIAVDAYPGRTFNGRIDFIYPQVDMTTRTVRARIVVSNPQLKLTPGMFVTVVLESPRGLQLVIPSSGVLQSGTRQVVFVNRGQGYLEPREVELGARTGDDFAVLKGLKEGDEIVTSANFLIDSESQLQAALGFFAPPPEASLGSAASAPQANVELTTDPAPPRRGRNTVRVRLSTASGASLSGADVSVAFLMPAMPAMGMAAMRAQATLAESGTGLYEGAVQLDSGGTWQVTVIAKKNGQAVAAKKFSLNATGGM